MIKFSVLGKLQIGFRDGFRLFYLKNSSPWVGLGYFSAPSSPQCYKIPSVEIIEILKLLQFKSAMM